MSSVSQYFWPLEVGSLLFDRTSLEFFIQFLLFMLLPIEFKLNYAVCIFIIDNFKQNLVSIPVGHFRHWVSSM